MKIPTLIVILSMILYGAVTGQAQSIRFKPDGANGQDICIGTSYGCTFTGGSAPNEVQNEGNGTELTYMDWTFNQASCPHGTTRVLLKFDGINTLPAGAVITNATLKMYGIPSSFSYGNSSYPASPLGTTNEGWVRRVTGNWAENTVTWNTQPSTTPANQVATPVSTSRFSWNMSVNVTSIIQDIISSGTNNGMMLMLQDEAIYRAVFFASSDYPDTSLWPELIIDITTPRITVDTVDGLLCAGAPVNIPFTASGIFNGGNVFTAQLSDASGSFATPATIGTLASTAGTGIIPGIIPATTPPGSFYRIRIVSSSQPITGVPNATNITIQHKPQQPGPIAGDTLACIGSAQLYSVPGVPGATSYTWTLPPGWTGTSATTAIHTIAGLSGGIISVTATTMSAAPRPHAHAILRLRIPPSLLLPSLSLPIASFAPGSLLR